MSLPTRRQAYALLQPLKGKSTTLIVGNRATNLAVARVVLESVAALGTPITLLDTSCFYGTNAKRLTDGLPRPLVQGTTLFYLSDEITDEKSLTKVLAAGTPALLIDDLNAVLHLLSSRGRRSGMHRLSTLYHMLSYTARLNGLLVLGTVYRSRFTGAATTRSSLRSLSQISDLQVTTELRPDGEVVFRCGQVEGWPADGFRMSPT